MGFLGDQNHVLARNFDVLREGAGLADRATFVVDPDGVIQLVEQTCEGVGRNANELVRKIRAAQYVRNNPGQVCPAAWEEVNKIRGKRMVNKRGKDKREEIQ